MKISRLSLLVSSLVTLMVSSLSLLVSPASAYIGEPIVTEQKVGARSTEQTGVTVKAKREKGGAIAFTVTRYIPKTQPFLSGTLPLVLVTPAVPIAPEAVVAPDTVVTTGPLPAPNVLAELGQAMITRTATLEVRSAKSLLCKTQVAAQRASVTGKDIEIYQFSLSPECIDYSTFSLNEAVHQNNTLRAEVGGTYTNYIFNLAEIVEESFKIHTPW